MSLRPVAPGGVRRKLLVLSSLIVATASLLMLLYFPRRWQRSILESAALQADALAEMAAWNVAIPLLFEDPVGAVESLGGARHAGGVLYVVACDQEGQVFAAHALEAAERLDYHRPSSVGAGLDEAYRVSAPILHQEREIGRLYLGLSLEAARAEIARLRLASALFGGLVLLLAIAAAAWMSAAVTRPLRDMVHATEEIRRGDWTRRATVTAKGEIGDLARAFNAMMDHLLQARVELAELNSDLEGRVVQRTVELEAEVAERRAREEELRLANERFALAAAAVSGAIYDWDVNSDTIRWSDGIQRAFGYLPEDTQRPIHWWTERLHPEDRERVVVQLADDLQHGRDFSAEYRFRTGEGAYLPVWDRGQAVRDGEGRIVRMVGVMENVAALKELEDQLRHVQKMEAVGLLAGGVAHDFNNLLTTILGYSDLLLASLPTGERHREQVREIQNAGQRAASLTRQLLAFSRREVVQPRVLDLNAVVTNLERMLRRLIGEDIRFETQLDEGLGNVRADRGQLEQLILNIAVNARDAMPQGGTLAITTRSRRLEKDFVRGNLGSRTGDYTVLEIVDTGCGMEESVRARIFEPFFTTKPSGKGTGLGMAIVYGVVKQCGGYVKAESAPGQGTTISVFLPAVAAASEAPGSPVAAPAPQGRDRTVLLVEDEGAVRGLVASVLRAHHFQVLEAADAEAALRIEAAFTGTIDLVLTDVVMPGLSGRELVERLLERRPRVRVLYMSGYTDDRIVRNGVHGAAQLLAKPFTPEELLRRVGASLAPQAADAAPEPLSGVA